MKTFDRKFGKTWFESLPSSPGVYRYYCGEGHLIYVGKAKNLRRRLGQYRNAKRRKAHRKMRGILAEAARIEFDACNSDLEALLLEAKWIQERRPKWNVTGAFSFMYPMLGVRRDESGTYLCLVSRESDAPGFSLHGAFRSRSMTDQTFSALVTLLRRIAPALPSRRLGRYGRQEGFKNLPAGWVEDLERFFRGESRAAMEALVLGLVDAPRRHRHDPKRIQRSLDALRWFWKHEATPLREARELCAVQEYPVAQVDRDPLMIRYRHLKAKGRSGETRSRVDSPRRVDAHR